MKTLDLSPRPSWNSSGGRYIICSNIKEFSGVGLEDLPLFGSILRSWITRVSTRPELFPCVEVTGWIFPQENARDMVIYNVEYKGFTSFTPTYISKAYKFPVSEFILTDNWINSLTIDYI